MLYNISVPVPDQLLKSIMAYQGTVINEAQVLEAVLDLRLTHHLLRDGGLEGWIHPGEPLFLLVLLSLLLALLFAHGVMVFLVFLGGLFGVLGE